ncbi:MAG: hypothetical protein ACKO0Z_25850 [Betaproteobacteria bacterium]
MQYALVAALAVIYPLVHIFNGIAFKFAEITPHIGLIYLPAFLRLFNVLILKPRDGTLATLIGGVLLMQHFNDSTVVGLLNVVCSAGGPLVALYLFKWHYKREFELTSLRDLTVLTLIYAPANALLHHLMWSQLDPSQLAAPEQVLLMTLGDILGALIGAYMLKMSVRWYRTSRINID